MIEPQRVRRLISAARSGLRGIRATPLVFLLSVTTMASGLLLLGSYLLVVQNMRSVLDRFGHDLKVVAFLLPEAASDPAAREALQLRLAALPGVQRTHFISSEQALERMRTDLGSEASILDALDENPLPASFEMDLALESRTPDQVRALASLARGFDGVEDVRYGADWIDTYARILRTVEWLGLALGIFLSLVLGTIVAGTVRLALYARSDEIQIQRLVGAGGLFVRLPFYLEGAIQGGLAAAVALGLLYGFFRMGLPLMGDLMSFLLGPSLPTFFGVGETLGLLALGVALGLGAAILSLLRLKEDT